jgi:hypothetical protein
VPEMREGYGLGSGIAEQGIPNMMSYLPLCVVGQIFWRGEAQHVTFQCPVKGPMNGMQLSEVRYLNQSAPKPMVKCRLFAGWTT